MKGARTYHVVPLSIQALATLKELHGLTGHGRYVFPQSSDPSKRISSSTITKALRTMGYSGDEMTDHGNRTIASTLLNESGEWRPDVIERQPAHHEEDEVRGAYNGAEYLAERRPIVPPICSISCGQRPESKAKSCRLKRPALSSSHVRVSSG